MKTRWALMLWLGIAGCQEDSDTAGGGGSGGSGTDDGAVGGSPGDDAEADRGVLRDGAAEVSVRPDSGRDAFVVPDASSVDASPGLDASEVDAFQPPDASAVDAFQGPDASDVDAFQTPDASAVDAFQGPDAFAPDAFVEPDAAPDMGVPGCGNPGADPTCREARDEPTCLARGGNWGVHGLAPFPSCLCPTRDGGCPCTKPDDCTGGCYAPLGDNGCDGVVAGTCAATQPFFGCWCVLFDGGGAAGLCID